MMSGGGVAMGNNNRFTSPHPHRPPWLFKTSPRSPSSPWRSRASVLFHTCVVFLLFLFFSFSSRSRSSSRVANSRRRRQLTIQRWRNCTQGIHRMYYGTGRPTQMDQFDFEMKKRDDRLVVDVRARQHQLLLKQQQQHQQEEEHHEAAAQSHNSNNSSTSSSSSHHA